MLQSFQHELPGKSSTLGPDHQGHRGAPLAIPLGPIFMEISCPAMTIISSQIVLEVCSNLSLVCWGTEILNHLRNFKGFIQVGNISFSGSINQSPTSSVWTILYLQGAHKASLFLKALLLEKESVSSLESESVSLPAQQALCRPFLRAQTRPME